MSTENPSYLDSDTRERLGKAAYGAYIAYHDDQELFTPWERLTESAREMYCTIAEAVIRACKKKEGDSHVQ